MAGYESSVEHLWDELERIDRLIRARTRLARKPATERPELWGMVVVAPEEVDAYLATPFRRPDSGRDGDGDERRAEDLAAEIARRRASTSGDVPLRVDELTRRFALSDLERDVVLTALLPELDPRYRRLFGYLQDDATRANPSVELALEILGAGPTEGRAAYEPGAPLIASELVRVENDAGRPLPARGFRVDDRIGAYLLGRDTPDGRLVELLTEASPLRWEDLRVDEEHARRLRALAGWLDQRQRAVVFFTGRYGSGRLSAARALSAELGRRLLVVDTAALLRSRDPSLQLVRLAYREAILGDASLYWSGADALDDPDDPSGRSTVIQSAESFGGITFLAAETAWDPTGQARDLPFVRVDVRPPPYALRRRLWAERLQQEDEFEPPHPDRALLADSLANSFQLTEGQVADAVAEARAGAIQRDPERGLLRPDDLYEGCRRLSGRRLSDFAQRIEPRPGLSFDDLVLPPMSERQLKELRDRIRLRSRVFGELGFEPRLPLGRGLIALFTGSSGTGKTMAAELLAREQGVDLYKVDLSAVVSKYVGETEKNLAQVFAEAESANALLFFDEGEALWGRRGEVRDARDRWANMEVNYLLQRVEEYAGVVVLASNMRQNIDEAFLRRIHAVVEFPFPEAAQRHLIWRNMFPPRVQGPDDEELALLGERFRIAGGSIRNAVVDAAFRALAEDGDDPPTITVRHLVLAVAREYQKLGKPITRGEFGEDLYDWVADELLSSEVLEPV